MKIFKKNLKKNNFNKFVKLFFVCVVLTIIVAIIVLIFKKTGMWQKVNSIDKIQALVEEGGIFSCFVFILLQILQTTILQVPAIIVTLAGTIIFGKWLAFFLSFIAIMIGSILMFWIGRKGGLKILNFLVGKDKTDKLTTRISECKYLFVLMMLFPLFPDDILCMVAGLTNMSFKFFFITNIVARFLGIGCTIFFGTGTVIPFHGWGLLVWGIILIAITSLFYFSIKYQDKIDEIVKQMANKSNK